MITEQNFQKAVDLIKKSSSALITTHTRVDGDACGCCLALSETLTALGKKTETLLLSSLPKWYEFLFDPIPPVLGKDITIEQLSRVGSAHQSPFDLIIILDTNSYSQLPKLDGYLKKTQTPILVIDHHATADGLGSVELVDPHAAATSLIVLDLLKFANWPVTEKIAQALFAGLATDTGWFRFTNTSAQTFKTAAELIDAGAEPAQIYKNIYNSFSPARFKLLTTALNSLQLHLADRLATLELTKADFQTTGANYEDTENLIDFAQLIASVEVSALFVELADGRIRCSLRSRGAVNVAQIAQSFDGGGHHAAAGTYLNPPIQNARKLILNAVQRQLSA